MARPRLHLALVDPALVAAILAGEKVCESRLSRRLHPARLARPGDRLLIKALGGDGLALATIRRVDAFDGLAPPDLAELVARYAAAVGAPPAYWAAHMDSRCAVFLWLVDARPTTIPGRLLPGPRAAWLTDYRPPPSMRALLPH